MRTRHASASFKIPSVPDSERAIARHAYSRIKAMQEQQNRRQIRVRSPG